MPQLEIDPELASKASTTEITIAVLPPPVREFGFVPNLQQLLPGDLILSRSRSPGILDRAIVASQKKGFADADARWTHAAVFIGGDELVEALPTKGIVLHSIYSYVPSEVMRVRRMPDISDSKRHKIANYATKNLGKRYSVFNAMKLGTDLFFRHLWNKDALRSNRYIVICSQLYFDSILEIMKNRLDGCPTEFPTTPAHLSATSDLSDVAVDWLRIAS